MSAAVAKALDALQGCDDVAAAHHLTGASATGAARVAQAIAWHLLRRPEASARALRDIEPSANSALRRLSLRTHADLCGELGWNLEARGSLERWLADDPSATTARRRLVDLLARGGAWEAANGWLTGVHRGELPMRSASVSRELGHHDVARADLLALRRPGLTVRQRRRLAERLAAAGAVADAVELLTLGDDSPAVLADRARLLTWWGRWSEAALAAGEALERGASGDARDRAETVLGICRLQQGPRLTSVVPDHPQVARARDLLSAVLARNPLRGEARLWRAHAHAILGDHEAALADIDAGIPAVGGFDLGGVLLRHLVEQRKSAARGFGGRSLDELDEGLARLGIPRSESRTIASSAELTAVIERALSRLAGNRSGAGTVLHPRGEPTPLGPSLSPRSDARHALELIRVCPPADVFERFDAVQARWPESSMGAVHRAELSLWLGDYEQARVGFERSLAINRHTRWGWIGQLANESFLGNPERALELGEQGVRVMKGYGPSHYVYRGEALLRLGRVAEARHDLEYAVQVGPSRMGARISLALICAEQGDNEALTAHIARLRTACPGMLATALEELDAPTSVVWGDSTDCSALSPVLRRAHEMMRGNRSSSCHTWFNAAGVLRINEDSGDHAEAFRARRADRLAQARSMLGLAGS